MVDIRLIWGWLFTHSSVWSLPWSCSKVVWSCHDNTKLQSGSLSVCHFEDYLNWTPPYCECLWSKIMWHEHTAQEKVMNILMLKEMLMNMVMKKFYNREETVSLSWYLHSMHSSLAVSSAILQLANLLVNRSLLVLEWISKLLYMQAEQLSISAPLSEHLTKPIKYIMNMMLILFHLLFGSMKGNCLKLGLQPSVLMFEKW